MTDNPIDIAQERIRYHQAEIDRLKAFLEMAEGLLKEVAVRAPRPSSIGDTNAAGPPTTVPAGKSIVVPGVTIYPATHSRSFPTPTKEVLLQAEELLRQMAQPMPASEIYDWLVRRGIHIAGKNPKGNLTAKFATQKERFTYDKDTGRWSLSEWTAAKTNEAPAEQSESASKAENKGPGKADMFS
jgi:hypothetical protein